MNMKAQMLTDYCNNHGCDQCAIRRNEIANQICQDRPFFEMDYDEINYLFEIAGLSTVADDTDEDPVNNPAHYNDCAIKPIDYIEDHNLGFHLGNAVKYISRAGKKSKITEIQDLKKAIWYIERRIQQLTKGVTISD